MGNRDVVIADVPGIIEGASSGVGLGLQFLKHISRSEYIAFLVDLSELTYVDAVEILERELEAYSPELTNKRRLIIGTKRDVQGTETNLECLREMYPSERVLGVSAHTGHGIPQLKDVLRDLIPESA